MNDEERFLADYDPRAYDPVAVTVGYDQQKRAQS